VAAREQMAEVVGGMLTVVAEPRRRRVALCAAGPLATPLRIPLESLAETAASDEARWALLALTEGAVAPGNRLIVALADRLRQPHLTVDLAEAIERYSEGRPLEPEAFAALGELAAFPTGAATKAAATILASCGREGLQRVVAVIVAATPNEQRVADWTRALLAARERGLTIDPITLREHYRRALPQNGVAIGAALLHMLRPERTAGQAVAGVDTRLHQELLAAIEQANDWPLRMFLAQALGRFLGIVDRTPDGRGVLQHLVDSIERPAPALAMAGVVAAEACLEFRPELSRDLAELHRRGRLRASAEVERYLISRVFQPSSLPAQDLPVLLDEPTPW
jgi:hypothetical protein